MSITTRLPAIVLAAIAYAAPAHAQGQQPRYQPGWPCTGTVDPAYVQMAEATGGVVMLFKPEEMSGTVAEMTASRRHPEVVFRASARSTDGLLEFDVPLDSSVESAYFFISLQCLEGISIFTPGGEQVRTDAAGVEFHAFDAIRLLTVAAPAPGTWKVRAAGRGFLSVIVKAKTDLQLDGVTFGAGGHPVKREPQRVEITMRGPSRQIAFHAMSARGGLLEPLNLELAKQNDAARTYAGEVTPPAGDFRVAMTGTDANGFRFQRVQDKLVVKSP